MTLHPTMESWHEALEQAKESNADHAIEINSPIVTSHWKCAEGKRGYFNRWGAFHVVQ